MENKNIFMMIASKIIVLALVFFLGFTVGVNYDSNKEADTLTQQEETSSVSLALDFGNGETEFFENVEVSGGESVFDVLVSSGADVSSKDFGGEMGVFIEEINGIGKRSVDQGKWWQFWVNGEYSQMGVSSYKINSGDSIEFKLTDERN